MNGKVDEYEQYKSIIFYLLTIKLTLYQNHLYSAFRILVFHDCGGLALPLFSFELIACIFTSSFHCFANSSCNVLIACSALHAHNKTHQLHDRYIEICFRIARIIIKSPKTATIQIIMKFPAAEISINTKTKTLKNKP